MRKFLTSLVIGLSTLAAVAACDSPGGGSQPTWVGAADSVTDTGAASGHDVQSSNTDGGGTVLTDTTPTGTDTGPTGTDTTPTEAHYYAIRVDDSPNYTCSPNQKAHGADIDAVGLYDGDVNLGWFQNVTGRIGDAANCVDPVGPSHTNFDLVKSAPDGTLSDGFVALGGGYVIGEFTSRTELVPAYTVQVIEVGVWECGDIGCTDEPYSVSAATDISCNDNSCMVLLSDLASGHATIPLWGI